jgi:hypothetical protein
MLGQVIKLIRVGLKNALRRITKNINRGSFPSAAIKILKLK